MEASSALTFSLQTHIPFNLCNSTSHPKSLEISTFLTRKQPTAAQFCRQNKVFLRPSRLAALLPPSFAVAEALEQAPASPPPLPQKKGKPLKRDKNGRFCSPRAARELALLIAYAACLDGSDPVRLFDKRVNSQRYPGFVLDEASLLGYDHMNFGGPPIATETEEEAEELLRKCDEESAVEEDVLSAPPKLVYGKSMLRLARNLLEAVVDRWDENILAIDKITPPNWKSIYDLEIVTNMFANDGVL